MKKKGLKAPIMTFLMLAGLFQSNYAQRVDTTDFVSDFDQDKPLVVKPHSPHKASLYSAVLPGLGQAYNKKYWKIPILYAGFVGMIYAIDFNSRMYNQYRNGYRDFLIQDPGNKSYLKILDRTPFNESDVLSGGARADWFERTLDHGKDYYKRYRDLSYVGFALVYVLNIIDATVDAHFKTFDISDDLSMRFEPVVQPGYSGNNVGLQLKIVF